MATKLIGHSPHPPKTLHTPAVVEHELEFLRGTGKHLEGQCLWLLVSCQGSCCHRSEISFWALWVLVLVSGQWNSRVLVLPRASESPRCTRRGGRWAVAHDTALTHTLDSIVKKTPWTHSWRCEREASGSVAPRVTDDYTVLLLSLRQACLVDFAGVLDLWLQDELAIWKQNTGMDFNELYKVSWFGLPKNSFHLALLFIWLQQLFSWTQSCSASVHLMIVQPWQILNTKQQYLLVNALARWH